MVRTRFAPSPTGYLHIGGLRTALYSYLFAKKNNGKFILRIEDTDRTRLVEDAVDIIIDTLLDAGVAFDEGPVVGGEFGPYIQSERKQLYIDYAKELIEKGGAYYCFCSKERLNDLRESGAEKYDKHCQHLSKEEVKAKLDAGESYVIRQNMPVSGTTLYSDMVFGDISVDFKELEDNVLIKGDGMATYNFANVVDDHLMEITHVIRGIEFLSSTPKYNHLYDSFGWQRPKYIHLQPIMRDSTHKLSKRDGDASYEDFIKKGFLKEAIVNYIALLGWNPKDNIEKLSLSDLRERFNIEGISHSPSIFDEVKMRYINSLYIKELSVDAFHDLVVDFYADCGFFSDSSFCAGSFDLEYLSSLLHSRTEVLSDVTKLTAFLTEFDNFDLNNFVNEKWKTDCAMAKKILPALIDSAEKDFDNLHSALEAFALENGYKKGQLLWIFRIAITGAKNTPGGSDEMARLLGKSRVISRLKSVLNRL